MIRRIPRIRAHGTQVLQMNFTQPTLQFLTHPQIDRKAIRLKFTFARMHRHGVAQRFVYWCPNGLKEQEQRNDGRNTPTGVIESERPVQIVGREAKREGVERGPRVQL